MIGAIIGILLGLTSYYIPLPFIPPIIGAGLGAALGANAIIQERRGEVRNKKQVIAGIAATTIGVLAAVLALIPIQ